MHKPTRTLVANEPLHTQPRKPPLRSLLKEIRSLLHPEDEEDECDRALACCQFILLCASITMRGSAIESEIAERTHGLRFCSSIDSTRASLTAAIRPATIAAVPPDLSDDLAAERGARKQSLSRYCRVSFGQAFKGNRATAGLGCTPARQARFSAQKIWLSFPSTIRSTKRAALHDFGGLRPTG